MQNSLGSGIYCREELLSLGARASRPHKTWQGRGDWLHRVGRFTRRLTLEQRLDKYAGGTPALPGGNPWLARCRSLSRALFCRSILPPSHARLRILQKAHRQENTWTSFNDKRHQNASATLLPWFDFVSFLDNPSISVVTPPNQQFINQFNGVHSCPFVVRRFPLWITLIGPCCVCGKHFPLHNLWRIPLEPSPTPSCPFVDNSFSPRALRGSPSWISFFLHCLLV